MRTVDPVSAAAPRFPWPSGLCNPVRWTVCFRTARPPGRNRERIQGGVGPPAGTHCENALVRSRLRSTKDPPPPPATLQTTSASTDHSGRPPVPLLPSAIPVTVRSFGDQTNGVPRQCHASPMGQRRALTACAGGQRSCPLVHDSTRCPGHPIAGTMVLFMLGRTPAAITTSGLGALGAGSLGAEASGSRVNGRPAPCLATRRRPNS